MRTTLFVNVALCVRKSLEDKLIGADLAILIYFWAGQLLYQDSAWQDRLYVASQAIAAACAITASEISPDVLKESWTLPGVIVHIAAVGCAK